VAERRKLVLPAKSDKFLQDLQQFTITVDVDGLDQVFNAVLDQARLYQRSAYDASYLELSKRRGIPLATKDASLKRGRRGTWGTDFSALNVEALSSRQTRQHWEAHNVRACGLRQLCLPEGAP